MPARMSAASASVKSTATMAATASATGVKAATAMNAAAACVKSTATMTADAIVKAATRMPTAVESTMKPASKAMTEMRKTMISEGRKSEAEHWAAPIGIGIGIIRIGVIVIIGGRIGINWDIRIHFRPAVNQSRDHIIGNLVFFQDDDLIH